MTVYTTHRWKSNSSLPRLILISPSGRLLPVPLAASTITAIESLAEKLTGDRDDWPLVAGALLRHALSGSVKGSAS